MPTLEWIGKDKVINHHNDVPYRVLDEVYTYGADKSENKIIRGDNLEALKALLPQYEGKIKCIYIDPPYNTGNEGWVYNDNVNDPKIKKWLGEVVGKEGEDLSRHDKWLCMMYPRLKLLQRLLADDGAIFISINNVESSNLRLVCNEVFGIRNFVSEIVCVNNPKGRSDDKYIATAHESVFIYKKNLLTLHGFSAGEHITKRYNKTDDKGEMYREIDLRKTGDADLRSDRVDMFYPFFYNEKTKELRVGDVNDNLPENFIKILPMKSATIEGRWRWGKDNKLKTDMCNLIARYMPSKKQWGIFEKDYLHKKSEVKPTSVWDFKDVNSERGTELFIKFLGFSKDDFPNPKPLGTIERILQIATDKNSIILDSFAGSGTTAHAVLNMNKADGGNRKFILVELMDYAETITAERVRRVINGYGEGKNAVEGTGGDFTFYDLGAPLMIDNQYLNEDVPLDKLRQYVFFMETKQTMGEGKKDEPYLLGTYQNAAYYFYYEKETVTTLDHSFLATIKTQMEEYLIYADINALSNEELAKHHIVFKKIPRDIAKL